jgi:ABC-type amino acid transport substrate-binding protein
MMQFNQRLFVLSLLLLFNTPLLADTLRIATWDRESKGPLVTTSEAILVAAYGELNQPLELVDLPVRRAMNMMLAGQIDGNFYRVGDIAQTHPNLFRVDTPINRAEVRIYVRNKKINPANWNQLQNLRVGYLRGTLLIEKNLPNIVRTIEGTSESDVFKLLSRDIVDVALLVELGECPPSSITLSQEMIRQDTVLEAVDLHHYLLARHREFGIQLNTVLQRMKNSGELQTIRLRTLKIPQASIR